MLALYLTSKNYNPFSITGRSALGVLSHPYVTSHVPKVTPQGHAARPKSHAAPQSHAAVSRRTSQKSCCSPKSRRRVTPHVPKVTLLPKVTPQCHAARPKSHAAPQSHAAGSRRTSQKSRCFPESRRRSRSRPSIRPTAPPRLSLLGPRDDGRLCLFLHPCTSATSASSYEAQWHVTSSTPSLGNLPPPLLPPACPC